MSNMYGGVVGDNPRGNDQFFTKDDVAAKCIERLKETLCVNLNHFSCIVEPSAGGGAFVRQTMLAGYTGPFVAIDIDAREQKDRCDFLGTHFMSRITEYRRGDILAIGNPPFGRNTSLAIKFFNRAAEFATVIAMIVPRSFDKNSIQLKLNQTFRCFVSEVVSENSFVLDNKDHNVPCTFQVWGHIDKRRVFSEPRDYMQPTRVLELDTDDFVFVTDKDKFDFAIRRAGVNSGRIHTDTETKYCHKTFVFVKVRKRENVASVLHKLQRLDLEKRPEKYNVAGAPSLSRGEICKIYEESMQ